MNFTERHRHGIAKVAVGVLLALGLFAATALAQNAQPTQVEVDKRVEALLSKLTLDEKITLLGGMEDFFTRPIPRLGIPSLKMSDGPLGVHDYGAREEYISFSHRE